MRRPRNLNRGGLEFEVLAPVVAEREPDISIVMPCLNEVESLPGCIEEAMSALEGLDVSGEVVVVDNGSTDDSARVADAVGARVVLEPSRGYGYACRRGLAEARGRVLVLGDADGTYDFSLIPKLIEPLESGNDLVIGSRLNGTLEHGAMPWLHRRVGNPLLTWMLNRLISPGISDAQCGMRAITKSAYQRLSLSSPGMEFASEFLIAAAHHQLSIAEVPIHYRIRSGGEPKLRTFRDGARHVRLILGEAGQMRRRTPRSDPQTVSAG